MANVIGVPEAFAASVSDLSALGSAWIFPARSFLRVIDWPLRFISQGTTIGFTGAPASPIVDAIGMPSSMWVAWTSPLLSESRIAAQLAPFETIELMPYFLKSPFSCATTIGEQSVSAMIPNFRSAVSGASLAKTEPTQPAGRPLNRAARPAPLAVVERKRRREMPEEAGRPDAASAGDVFMVDGLD
jgi:hypothetical protein